MNKNHSIFWRIIESAFAVWCTVVCMMTVGFAIFH